MSKRVPMCVILPVGLVLVICAWLPRGVEAQRADLPDLAMAPIKMPNMGGGSSVAGGPVFPDDRRVPVVTEALRRLRTTRHEDTVVDALACIATAQGAGPEIDVFPVVEPLAFEGSDRVRSQAILTLHAVTGGDVDRRFCAIHAALRSGRRGPAVTAILRMSFFDDPEKARKTVRALMPFLKDPEPAVREKAAVLCHSHIGRCGLESDSELCRQFQEALRTLYRDGASPELRLEILDFMADPADPAWEPIAREALLSTYKDTGREALWLLGRIWARDRNDPRGGAWRRNQLALDYLSSEEKAKRDFAVRYMVANWTFGRREVGLVPAGEQVYWPTVRTAPEWESGRRTVKALYWSGHRVTLTVEARAELKAAKAPDWFVRELETMAGTPPEERNAVAVLVEELTNDDAALRQDAAWHLGTLRSDDKRAVAALIRALKDDDNRVRWAAEKALQNIGPGAADAVDALVEALKDEHPQTRIYAVWALRYIGPAARKAVPELFEALKDGAWQVRYYSGGTLAEFGPDALDHFIKRLKSTDEYARRQAAECLGEMKQGAAGAVPALREALKDKESFVRSAVAATLNCVGPAAAQAVPELIDALADTDVVTQQYAASALATLGGVGDTTVRLTRALEDERPAVRRHAAWALGGAGASSAPAVPALVSLLKDPDGAVRWTAAAALREIGPAASGAVDSLIRLMQTEDWQQRGIAAEILSCVGPAAEPALQKALQDDDPAVRLAAAHALRRIETLK